MFVGSYKKLKAFWKLVGLEQKRNTCPQEPDLIGKGKRQRWSVFSRTLWYLVTFSCLSYLSKAACSFTQISQTEQSSALQNT